MSWGKKNTTKKYLIQNTGDREKYRVVVVYVAEKQNKTWVTKKLQYYTYVCDKSANNVGYSCAAVTWDAYSTCVEYVPWSFSHAFIAKIISIVVWYVIINFIFYFLHLVLC